MFTLVGCGGSNSTSADNNEDSGDGSKWSGCDYVEDITGAAKEVEVPASSPELSAKVSLEMITNSGQFNLVLDGQATPCTVNSFLSLAQQDYFDNTICHRLTTGDTLSVLQCGDPSESGSGGPGYMFADELTGSETYPAGTLAMANAGPDTNGSQFFMVYKDSQLPPSYTVFGKFDAASIRLLQKIAAKGTVEGTEDGHPAQEVLIEDIVQR
jgi:peptidyl-prolyl cis-trans isomerase B (cyclophilin B)